MSTQDPRVFVSRRFYDPQTQTYLDEELPTVTLKLQGIGRRASSRMPRGTVEGTYRITGTNYDLTPGTYSLRALRVTAGISGPGGAGTRKDYQWSGTTYAFYVRHTRQGTLLFLPFDRAGVVDMRGNPRDPVFAVGPGTLAWAWQTLSAGGVGTRVTVSQQIEGLLS